MSLYKIERAEQTGEDDGRLKLPDPTTYSAVRRWSMVWLLTLTSLIASMYAVAFEPALPYIMNDLGFSSPALSTLTISVYVLGYVFGPLLTSPAAEYYGRLPLLHAAWALFLLSLAVCATSRSIALFIAFRAIMGFAGVTFLILGPAVIADVIPKDRRGMAMSAMVAGPSLGPTLGTLIGGYVVESLDWTWIFWIGMMALGSTWILGALIMKETYQPILRARAAAGFKENGERATGHDFEVALKEPSIETAQVQPQTREEPEAVIRSSSNERVELRLVWLRPLRLIVRSPIVVLVALYTSLLNSYVQVCFATVGTVFQAQYGFSTGSSGLAYQGLTVGFLFCQLTLGKFSDRYQQWMEERHRKKCPEFRLPPLLIGAVCLPAGFFWYGWALESHAQFMVPIAGTMLIAIGVLYGYIPVQLYLVDAYTQYAASATGAATIVRSLVTALLPLIADPIYQRLGYGWGNSLLAFIAIGFVPFAWLLYRYGERIRTNPRFQPEL